MSVRELALACPLVLLACGGSPGPQEKPAPGDPAAIQKVPVSASLERAEPVVVEAMPKGVTTENLRRFFPETIKGAPRKVLGDRMMGGPAQEGFAAAAYMLDDEGGVRFVNINLQKVVDLGFEQAQFQVEAGESQDSPDASLLGKSIDGRLAQRRYSPEFRTSEVIVLLREAILVRVSVEKATSPDEAFEVLAALDLAGLEQLVP